MLNLRTIVLTSLAAVALVAVWHSRIVARENSSAGIVTLFDHAKMDASFAKAASAGGSTPLWSRTSSKGTYVVDTHNRDSLKAACKPEGCSHKGFTEVLYVVSGAATLVVGGSAKTAAPDKFGGQSVQGGESRRVSKGDVHIMPPDTVHWYQDVEEPFRYLGVAVP